MITTNHAAEDGTDLQEFALSLGAELYGVASVADYADRFPDKPQPTRFLEGAPSIVVIGLPFEPGTVATVLSPELAGLRAKATENVGASAARPVGAERFFLSEENAVPFYHIPAMHLAGLGTLGLNCCILTPQFGPRVFVTSIITDRTLPAGEPLQEELCTRCRACVDGCPIQAIDGEGWKNPFACASYGCCGTCIAICPVGEI